MNTMKLYPAIDLLDGQVVRLRQGDYERSTSFSNDPLAVAKSFQEAGCRYLHVVDLNAARGDAQNNREQIEAITRETDLEIQVGGGIRSAADIEELLSYGVRRLVLGTAAIRDPEFLRAAVRARPDAIVLGLDAYGGQLRVQGWLEETGEAVMSFAKIAQEMDVRQVVYTDIRRDGEMQGPDLETCVELTETLGLKVTLSGGVSSLADIEAARAAGIDSVIVGRALYEGRIPLDAALEVCRR